MSEFNENPFKADTPVIPFSNGMEFETWTSNNCEKCIKMENESTKIEDAKCKLAFHIAMSTVTGTIPLESAWKIGCKYNALYQTCELNQTCKCFDDGNTDNPF